MVLRRETLRSLPRLRLICVAATGTNNIDLEAAAELGIEVKNAAGYSTHSVAETTLGAAIALRRNIVYYDRYVKSGAYSAAGQQFHFALPTHQLYGSKWGIVGLGAIGREVARLAAAFGCEVCYTSTSGVVREEPYPALPLTELLGRSDIVSIHAPLNDRTRGLIGAPELSVMKRSALLINVARGGIVDEAALAEALDRGSIAGAGPRRLLARTLRRRQSAARHPRTRPPAALAPQRMVAPRSRGRAGRMRRGEYQNISWQRLMP